MAINFRPVRLAYQPPASNTFLSEQTSHQQPANSIFSQNKPAPAISHQPNEQAVYRLLYCVYFSSGIYFFFS
jgi:hypothetical protein